MLKCRIVDGIEAARVFKRSKPCYIDTMTREDKQTDTPEGERIAKVIARAGLCSRRQAEQWIEAGRVQVNGRKISSPALNVTAKHIILVDGKPLVAPDPPRLWRYHKPSGLVTTERDPQGRPTIYTKLPSDLPRVLTVGRLDMNTEGLLLLTNDGNLKRYLELPDTGWQRRYRVRAYGRPNEASLVALKKGITIDGIDYRSIDAQFERQQGGNAWLTVSLREGKNREVKRVLEHIGLQVNRLIRLSFGPFQLGQLEEGVVEEVPRKVLRQQLGAKWAQFAEGYADEAESDATDTRSAGARARDIRLKGADIIKSSLARKASKVEPENSLRSGHKPGGKRFKKGGGSAADLTSERPRAGGANKSKFGATSPSKPSGKTFSSKANKPLEAKRGDSAPGRGGSGAKRADKSHNKPGFKGQDRADRRR